MKRKCIAVIMICLLFAGCSAALQNATPIQQETTINYDAGAMYLSARTQYVGLRDAETTTPEQKLWLEKNVAPFIDKYQDAWLAWAKAVSASAKGEAGGNMTVLKGNYEATMQQCSILIAQYISQQVAKKKVKKEVK